MSADYSVVPLYNGREIHIHISGSIAASLMPWWIHWLRHTNPGVTINVSVSAGALRFASVDAIRELANGEVWTDSWDEAELPRSWRSGQSGGSECILILPATLDTLMRLSQGRSDSPALMMLQVTELPVIIGDSIPATNRVVDEWLGVLAKRPNVHFAPRVTASRADDRTLNPSGFNVPGAIGVANDQILKARS